MTDDRAAREDDQVWLLARERGQAGPPISEASARRYDELGTLIAGLPPVPAGTAERPGWEHDVLAAIDAEASAAGATSEASRRSAQAASVAQAAPAAPASRTDDAGPVPAPSSVRDGRPTTATRRRRAMAGAALAMAVFLALVIVARRDDSGRAGPVREVRTSVGGSGTASFTLEIGPDPTRAPIGPHGPHAEGSLRRILEVQAAIATAAHELHDGDTVVTGDRMHATVTTSVPAQVYLAYCSRQRLQLYPSLQGTPTAAGQPARIPGDGDLVFDDHVGPETLYLIVSYQQLADADPALAALITAAAAGIDPVDCGPGLDLRMMQSPHSTAPATGVLRGMPSAAGRPPAVVADPRDVAIVRYRLSHVAGDANGVGRR